MTVYFSLICKRTNTGSIIHVTEAKGLSSVLQEEILFTQQGSSYHLEGPTVSVIMTTFDFPSKGAVTMKIRTFRVLVKE